MDRKVTDTVKGFFFFWTEFYGFINMNTVCTQAVSSFSLLLSLALGLVKLGCSSLGGLAVVRGDVVSCLSTGRSVARQQHFRLLGV